MLRGSWPLQIKKQRTLAPGRFYFMGNIMAKRLTATEKWIDPWFCSLGIQDKLFWIYICDNCDHAGIWNVNWPLVKFHIGEYDFKKEVFNGRIDYLDNETWFLRKFVFFQQKIASLSELNPANRCHSSIINILSKKGMISPLEAPCKGLARVLGNSNSKGKGNKGIVKGKFDFKILWDKYPNKDGRKSAERSFNASILTEQDYKDIGVALDNYLKSEPVAKGFIKNGSTWFNNWRDWIVPPKKGLYDDRPEYLRPTKQI